MKTYLDIGAWSWPQGAMLVWVAIGLAVAFKFDGWERAPYSFSRRLSDAGILIALLVLGGFFA